MGISVESNNYLRECDARIKFLSLEPLIDFVDKFDYIGIDGVYRR